jgi:hypothetical protein
VWQRIVNVPVAWGMISQHALLLSCMNFTDDQCCIDECLWMTYAAA